jgi:hypothetical protein
MTTDLRAIAHILHRTDVYQKPEMMQKIIERMLGRGVLVAEGEAHRIQRKALNPAFGPGQLRDLTGVMLDKSNEVRDDPQTVAYPALIFFVAEGALVRPAGCGLRRHQGGPTGRTRLVRPDHARHHGPCWLWLRF